MTMTQSYKPRDVVVLGTGKYSYTQNRVGRGKSRFLQVLMDSPEYNVIFLTPEEYHKPKSIEQYIIDEEFTTLPAFEDNSFSYTVNRRKPKPYWLQKQRW